MNILLEAVAISSVASTIGATRVLPSSTSSGILVMSSDLLRVLLVDLLPRFNTGAYSFYSKSSTDIWKECILVSLNGLVIRILESVKEFSAIVGCLVTSSSAAEVLLV